MTGRTPFALTEELPWEDLGSGLQRKILGYDDKLMMTHMRFKKGAVGAVHKHPHTQVSYIVQGSFEVQVGSEKKVLSAGDSFHAPSNVEHGVVALEDSMVLDIFTPMREEFLKR